jgi:dolichol-phosphate mannosyltransferase
MKSLHLTVVIPCYRVPKTITELVSRTSELVDRVIVVDDACPERPGELVRTTFKNNPKIVVLTNKQNAGVGGATIRGYLEAIKLGTDIVVKLDGDGQMDPKYINRLVHPIKIGIADFTKANRFYDREALNNMPLPRRVGNIGLSVICKAVTGFWHLSDPTNGFTAINVRALKQVNLNKVYRDYFFEISMLIRLNAIRATTMDLPIPAKYGDEKSSLKISKILRSFPIHLIRGLGARVFWRYLIYDINAVAIFLLMGSLFFGFGVIWGGYHWMMSINTELPQTAGTVAIAFLPMILGFQMLLQAMLLDIIDKPDHLISHRIEDEEEF